MALDDHPALAEYRAAMAADKEISAMYEAARAVCNGLLDAMNEADKRTKTARRAILEVLTENPDSYPGWAAVSRFANPSVNEATEVTPVTFATAPNTEKTEDRRTSAARDRRANG